MTCMEKGVKHPLDIDKTRQKDKLNTADMGV